MIDFDGVKFGYGRKSLFDGLTFRMEESNIYGLLGLNGAGKTTLLRLISGQLKPQAGSIRVNGQNPFLRNPDLLNRISFLPEEFELPPLTMSQYIKGLIPFYPAFSNQVLEDNNRLLGLDDIDPRTKLTRLSFGQKKKFRLAVAMACGADYLLLDEPTNGMDIPGKDRIRQAVAGGLRENQIVLISTHQVRDLERLMEPVMILDRGRMLYHGNPEDLRGRYSFRMTNDEIAPGGKVLYCEPVPGGNAVVEKGQGKATPDLEFLFKTFVLSEGRFSGYLAGQEVNNEKA